MVSAFACTDVAMPKDCIHADRDCVLAGGELIMSMSP